MQKTDWRLRFLVWWARRICKVPFIVNFTPEWMDEFYAVGFAASPQAANRMRGDDMLIERIQQAETAAMALKGTRKGRRVMNRAAKRAAERQAKR